MHNTNLIEIKPTTCVLVMASRSNFLLHAFLRLALATTAFTLSPKFYDRVCPQALPAIKRIVQAAVHREPRMGASLLRLHFHDCFVNDCDGSLLLDSTPAFETEKNARGNLNSVRGFEVVDEIKAEVDRVCGRPVLGGPAWKEQNLQCNQYDPAFAKQRRATCPRTGGNTNLAPFDSTPAKFDTAYFSNLVKQRDYSPQIRLFSMAAPPINL
ncbi:putative Peroxidase superfamily protein [Hibiscus syriacus]|uniref:peroxidase n=1 Tax=Hibiscus syriacus TaxID=106335 RepID=A0A6A3AV07_HIBSY|nr:putative Peroxidase superfamily protein [Hibiscus syriacus]